MVLYLAGPYVPLRVTRGALVAHRYILRFIHTASLQNLAVQQDFYSPLGVPLERSSNPVFDGVGLVGFKSRAYMLL